MIKKCLSIVVKYIIFPIAIALLVIFVERNNQIHDKILSNYTNYIINFNQYYYNSERITFNTFSKVVKLSKEIFYIQDDSLMLLNNKTLVDDYIQKEYIQINELDLLKKNLNALKINYRSKAYAYSYVINIYSKNTINLHKSEIKYFEEINFELEEILNKISIIIKLDTHFLLSIKSNNISEEDLIKEFRKATIDIEKFDHEISKHKKNIEVLFNKENEEIRYKLHEITTSLHVDI